MKLIHAAPALTALLLILGGCGESDTRAADVKAIKDIETSWVAEVKAKDIDKILAHYTDDAVLMSPGAPAASTPDARKSAWKGLIGEATALSFQASSVDVAKSGDLATTRGSYTMTLTDPATKKTVNDRGSYVTAYKKQSDGTWKAYSDINVSEVPPVAAPAPAKSAARKAATKKKRR